MGIRELDTERRAQFNFVNCAPPLQAYQFPAAEKDHMEAVLKLLFARRGSAEPAPSRRTTLRAPTDIWTGRCYDSFGAKVRVGESISAQFGGAISLQDRSTFELRDYAGTGIRFIDNPGWTDAERSDLAQYDLIA